MGVTGLETAIILIAFIMVASVLAYVVLSAGLYSSQKAKEAVHLGLQESRNTMDLRGNGVAKMVAGEVTEVYFTVGCVTLAESIDFTDTSAGANVVVISYSDAHQQLATLDWAMTKLATINDDNLLEPNELFQITVDMAAVNTAAGVGEELGAYSTFVLEVKPPSGAVLAIERTVPARVSAMVNLH